MRGLAAGPRGWPIPGLGESGARRRPRMVPLLLWILGVPGLIILLLLVLGIISI
jgi:hypothetical protein